MPSNNIPHYLYKRNHRWWFRKRITLQGCVTEFRFSLQTADLVLAQTLALRTHTLCMKMVASLGAPSQKSKTMNDLQKNAIDLALKAQIAEWTAEETERWFDRSERTGTDINDILHVIDMLQEDLGKRVRLDNRPDTRQSEADIILDKLPHLRASLSDSDIQFIAREVALGKIQSLSDTRDIILGRKSRLSNSFSTEAPSCIGISEINESPSLSELFEKYAEENKVRGHSRKTTNKYDWYRALVISFFGDVHVHTITGSMGRELYESLSKLPLGLKKEVLLQSNLRELIEANDGSPISLVTASGHQGKIAQFFDWVVDRKHINTNPFPSKGIPQPKKNHKDDRPAVTDDEAKKVFSQPLFTDHIGIKTSKVQHPHHFFLPLICLFTGMRAGEIAQLYIDDIETVGEVPCIRIDKQHDDQWLKTPNAKRYIPLHNELIRFGFLRFVNDLKEKTGSDTRLFPNIPIIQDGYSAKPSEWFIRNFRKDLNQPKHVTLHGFRHTFRDKIAALTESDERVCRLMGHKTSNYGNSLQQEQQVMQGLVNSIEFGEIVSDVKPYTSLSMFHQLNGRA